MSLAHTVPGGFNLRIFLGQAHCVWCVLLLIEHRYEIRPKGRKDRCRIINRVTVNPDLSARVPLDWTGVLWVIGQFKVLDALLSLSAGLHCQIHILHVLIMGCYSFLQRQEGQRLERFKEFKKQQLPSQQSVTYHCVLTSFYI